LGKFEKLPEEYKSLIHKDTQPTGKSDKPKIRLNPKNDVEYLSRGSLAWFGRQTHNLESEKKRA
jgi:hypothetical protein